MAEAAQNEIALWAHETPFLNEADAKLSDIQEGDAKLAFTFQDIPTKIREAEQYYDKCDYDVSTAILAKCLELYTTEYGEEWYNKALDADRELINLPNIDALLQFGRLVKEYSLNMILLARIHDSLSNGPDEEQKGEGEGEGEEVEQGPAVENPLDGGDFDDDSDEGDDCEEKEDSHYSYASENLQLAFQIFGRYIIERSFAPTGDDANDDNKKISETRTIQDANGKDVTLTYALGNKSQREIPASDLLPFLWRKENGVSIRDVEICQVYLGDVYDSLADIHCEEEQWNDAANYLQLSLRLRQRTEKAYGRGLASIHVKYAQYYSLRHNYEESNKHYLLAASVFARRTMDKIDWLYTNLNQHYKLDHKCPNPLTITRGDSSQDADVLVAQEDIISLRRFVNDQLVPTITNQIFTGEITLPQVREAVNNITDYFQIIDSVMHCYEDNLQDIAEGQNQEGMTVKDQAGRIDEEQRVKAMVNEVMRTDSLLVSTSGDYNEALGFKKINKTGDLQTTLEQNQANPSSQHNDTGTSILTPSDEASFVPVVKRKARVPAEGSDATKKQKTEQQ